MIESLLWAVLEAGEIAINKQKYVCPQEGKVSKPNIKPIRRHGEKEHGKGLGNSGGEGSEGQLGGLTDKTVP